MNTPSLADFIVTLPEGVYKILKNELNICDEILLNYKAILINYGNDPSSVSSGIFPGQYTYHAFDVTPVYDNKKKQIGTISFNDIKTQINPKTNDTIINEIGSLLLNDIGNCSYIYSFPSQLQYDDYFPPNLKFILTEFTNKSGYFLNKTGYILIIPQENGTREVYIIYTELY